MTSFQKSPKKLVEEFEAAIREHAFIGALDPADHSAVERQYDKTKAALLAMLDSKKEGV